ncbi:MAG TPA: hypothetical protein VL401_00895 [Alphaproteobacteria bacterium]|jgi:hypothetical protein|nr:hypothetical protein [Alphaproteobacteria bacterium]
MITETRNRIISYIKINKQARVGDLVKHLGLSNVAIHKQLNKLLEKSMIKKVGSSPLVFYVLDNYHPEEKNNISESIKKIIDQNYLYISPAGEILNGFEGFLAWVKNINQEKYLESLAREYTKIIIYPKYIDASFKIKSTFKEDAAVEKLFYSDFYSLPKFGKTKLGQMVLYAKQSQNRDFISKISSQIKPDILDIIRKYNIDAVSFIPPTVPRQLQFITEVEKNLNLGLPKIDLVKVSGEIIIPQKTLSKLEERIINAKETIFIKKPDQINYKNILLIDDATGSGATFNEVAKKIKDKMNGTIYAFAIVGSIKGFDVISEV